jgi:hypothetical protein
MGGVALHFDRASVFHGGHERAGIGAIVRAGTQDVVGRAWLDCLQKAVNDRGGKGLHE